MVFKLTSLLTSILGIFGGSNDGAACSAPCVAGDESIMRQKAHGTSEIPVQQNLRWNCDWNTADRICNFNRHYAEFSGYFQRETTLVKDMVGKTDFFDSNTGKRLFTAPIGRSVQDFLQESALHGWPSFRDNEVNWNYVRVLPNGETVSVDGTHLGHNLPDSKGNRFCINLVSVAGNPPEEPGTDQMVCQGEDCPDDAK